MLLASDKAAPSPESRRRAPVRRARCRGPIRRARGSHRCERRAPATRAGRADHREPARELQWPRRGSARRQTGLRCLLARPSPKPSANWLPGCVEDELPTAMGPVDDYHPNHYSEHLAVEARGERHGRDVRDMELAEANRVRRRSPLSDRVALGALIARDQIQPLHWLDSRLFKRHMQTASSPSSRSLCILGRASPRYNGLDIELPVNGTMGQ
jgi:hypothetical protein